MPHRMSRPVTSVLVAALVTSAAAAAPPDAPLEPGLTVRVYEIGRDMSRLHPLAPDQTPNVDRRLDRLDLEDSAFGGPADFFVVEAFGWLVIPEAGQYEFALRSDDGARLRIDGETIVVHDGLHAATTRTGAAELAPGLHAFHVDMFENQGGAALSLSWRPPGAEEFTLVPAEAFRTERGVTRVVSPGRKTLLDGREHLRPGDGLPLDAVHPGWAVEPLRPAGFEPQVGGMALLPDGRLVVSSFQPVNNGVFRRAPNGTLWIVEGALDGTPETISATVIADGFHDPSGVAVVDGDIYVSHRTDITRLRDLDGDGTFEDREVFVAPWVSDNYHHFSFGLVERDGWLYGTLSTSIYFDNTMTADGVQGEVISMNGPNPPHRGTCYRVNLETREVEFLAGGFRTPNGIGITRSGAVLVTDNQGAWLPASKLVHVQPGRFYGHYNGRQTSDRYPDGGHPALHADQPVSPPAVWLPQNECANSPTTPIEIRGGPFDGQVLVGELTMGGIRRVFLEEVGGELQGAAFRFTQGFECGVNRVIDAPDGTLLVGGTGAGGNWTWRGTQHGLERLRPTGEPVLEYHSMSARPDGFEVRLTRPVDPAWLADPAHYEVRQWRYHATPQYGGPKFDEQRLAVSSATPATDGRSVRLVIPGLRPDRVVHLRTNPTGIDGEPMWATEAWYTLNRIPSAGSRVEAPVLRPFERRDLAAFAEPTGTWAAVGNVSTAPSRADRLDAVPGHGAAWNGPEGRGPDLITAMEHADVEVHVEFMVPEGSNSGVYFMGRYEIQILDSHGRESPRHDDCGGVYQRWSPARGRGNEGFEGVPPRVNAAAPPGTWQTYDVIFRAPRFDATGRKIRNARFERVVHNGVLIHEDVDLSGPTRAGYEGEVPFGPLRLQGDHGPVAYRNLVIRLLDDDEPAPGAAGR